MTDANLGERVGVVLVEAARGRPNHGRVEVYVLHVVLAGLMHSLWCGSGAACWSKWLTAARALMCVEVVVLHVVVACPVGAQC